MAIPTTTGPDLIQLTRDHKQLSITFIHPHFIEYLLHSHIGHPFSSSTLPYSQNILHTGGQGFGSANVIKQIEKAIAVSKE